MIAILLHKANVQYEVHGWSPKYFTPALKRYRKPSAGSYHVWVGLADTDTGTADRGLARAWITPTRFMKKYFIVMPRAFSPARHQHDRHVKHSNTCGQTSKSRRE